MKKLNNLKFITKCKKFFNMKPVFNNLKFMTKFIVKYGKLFFPIAILSGVFQAAYMLVNIIGIKYVLDSLFVGQSYENIFGVILIYGLSLLLIKLFITLTNYIFPVLSLKISVGMSNELMKKSRKLDFSCFDNPLYYDIYTRAVSDADRTVQSLIGTYIAVFSNVISVVTILSVLTSLGIEFIIIALFNVTISYVMIVLQNKWQYNFDMSTTRVNRAMGYFKGLFFNPSSAKEIRIFDSSNYFASKYMSNAEPYINETKKFRKKYLIPNYIENLLSFCTLFITMFLAGLKIIVIGATVGTFMATVNSVNSLTDQLFSLVSQIPNIIQQSRYIENVKKVIEAVDPIENSIGPEKLLLVKKDSYSIAFENVSFMYPNSNKVVLDNVSFKIKESQKVAIVGENGSGKTTIVKLLLRLYDPIKGEIFIDDINIKNYNINSLRTAFSTVFQDFQSYATTVKENITFDDTIIAEDLLRKSIEMVKLTDKIALCDNNVNSNFTKMFYDDGVVFSGGETQKLSIARAYYRNAGIMVMDEPSSALDPLAENTLINIINTTIKQKTAIIISHRLIICKNFDKIIHMDNGKVIEEGSHKYLMDQKGKYSTMFNLQQYENI